MKKYKKYVKLAKPVINYFVIVLGALVFTLLLLPSLFLFFHGGGEPTPEKNIIVTRPEKLAEPATISIYRTATNTVEAVAFEEYVKGVVAGEMPANFEAEALKAQAVCARTYSLSKVLRSGQSGNPEAHPSAPLCDSTHCQVYRSQQELAQIKPAEWMETGWPKITKAVDDTKGEMMYYQGQLVEQALFHSSSGGKTENSEDVFVSAVPYLRSVESPLESEATHQNERNTFSVSTFVKKLNSAFPAKKTGTVGSSDIKIISRSEGGRVDAIQVGNTTFSGRDVRTALGLPSANFAVDVTGDSVIITSNGFGHGVGMSQYGANGMAQAGEDYRKILSHYYSGVEIF